MKFLLIDGNSLINRSFYAIRLLSNKQGVYTNAITGFFSTLLRLRNSVSPDCAAVAFDLRAPTFRHQMYDGYKKRRKGMPEELAGQLPYIKEILDAMGIPRVECPGFEADDIIGTLAMSASMSPSNGQCGTDMNNSAHVSIATGDRDAFQLIGERVSVILASTKEELVYTPEKIRELYGIEPPQFISVKALMGDTSDDIPGVAGIGEKTALSLIQKFGTVEHIYNNLDTLDISPAVKLKLQKDKDSCFLSAKLAQIATDAPINTDIGEYKIRLGDMNKLAEILSRLEIFSLLKRLELQPVHIAATATTSLIEPTAETETSTPAPDVTRETQLPIDAQLEPVLRDMERAGIMLDADGLRRFGEELLPQIEHTERQIHQAAGVEFLVSSPKQLSEVLFEKLELPHAKKTKTGYSTGSEVLESLAGTHPIIPLIMEYRELTKLHSTYVVGLLKRVDEDGRIHTTFKNETRTGRLSSVEPNIQNIPVRTPRGRVMRRFFIAEPGNLLIDADYSQIELRVLAEVSGDDAMLRAFREGADIHAITASQIFKVNESDVTREMRGAAKAVNFGIVYGMGAFSLAKEIGVSASQANDYIERYLSKYEGVREYLEKTVRDAKATGYVKTLLGRVRYIPELSSTNKNIIAHGERIAKNTPIQGTAADIIKVAMIKVHTRLLAEAAEAKLILQVHDELIVESPQQVSQQAALIVKEEMVAAGRELGVDLEVDVEMGKTWYETH